MSIIQPDRSEVTKRLKSIRKALNLTQKEFSEALGLTRTYWASIESGQRDLPGSVIKSLIIAFNVSANWLITGDGQPSEYGELRMVKIDNEIEQKDAQLDKLYNQILHVIELREKAFGEGQEYDNYVSYLGQQKQEVFTASLDLDKHDAKKLSKRLSNLIEMFTKDFDELFNQYFLDVMHPRRRGKFKTPQNVKGWN